MVHRLIKYSIFWIAVIIGLIYFIGFAGHNDLSGVVNDNGRIAGFWVGLVHGFLSIISLLVSLFNKNINIYEIYNTGLGYNVGFVMGFLLWIMSSKLYRIYKTQKI